MPRRPRIEEAGFHHIINRGVAKTDIFLSENDYIKFLAILQKTKERYIFNIHSFCLMSNHYHILIETQTDNISLIARQINSQYAQYFNKKYNRVGPLWQGRFKNFYIFEEQYLYILLRYIEQNPIKAGITSKIGEYKYSSTHFLYNKDKNLIALIENSKILDKNVLSMIAKKLTDYELKSLEDFQKTKYEKRDELITKLKQKTLKKHFKNVKDINKRNQKIYEAVIDGYKQTEIAKFLGVSTTTISKSVKKITG